MDYQYDFHIALDGNGANGLEGYAGVCCFRFDPNTDAYGYKVAYFDGVAGGHAVAVNPSGTVGFLGNTGQHLLFYDARTLEEVGRVSTLRFESPPSALQGSTHLVWVSDSEFITAIGRHFYRFSLDDLTRPELVGEHGVKLPHAMKLTSSGRYLVYGSMDSPASEGGGEARHVGIWDLQDGSRTIVDLPATCWHVLPAATDDLFYAVSFRVEPRDYIDYSEWAMAFKKEYVFEIDAVAGRVVRHWSASREIPAHINSDLALSDSEFIFCNGGSQSIVFIDLESFASYRCIDEAPSLDESLNRPREMGTQVYDVLARGNPFLHGHHLLGALRVSRFRLLDSVYATQLAKDQSLLFTANRGMNHVTIYDYPSNKVRLRVDMPPLGDFQEHLGPFSDQRLGFHHSALVEQSAPD